MDIDGQNFGKICISMMSQTEELDETKVKVKCILQENAFSLKVSCVILLKIINLIKKIVVLYLKKVEALKLFRDSIQK